MFVVRSTRDLMLSLLKREDYTSTQRQYLAYSIEGILELEELVTNLKESNFYSKKDLRIQFHNLKAEIMRNFMMYSTFYEIYQEENGN